MIKTPSMRLAIVGVVLWWYWVLHQFIMNDFPKGTHMDNFDTLFTFILPIPLTALSIIICVAVYFVAKWIITGKFKLP